MRGQSSYRCMINCTQQGITCKSLHLASQYASHASEPMSMTPAACATDWLHVSAFQLSACARADSVSTIPVHVYEWTQPFALTSLRRPTLVSLPAKER